MIEAIFYHPLQQSPFLLSSFVFLYQRISSTPPWLSKLPSVLAIADSIPNLMFELISPGFLERNLYIVVLDDW